MPPERDWLDYAQAIGGIVGALAALVALWLAQPSAADAKSSAISAQRTAVAAEAAFESAEAERLRAPRLTVLELSASLPAEPDPLDWIVSLTIENSGTKPAERLTVNVLVPPRVRIFERHDLEARDTNKPATLHKDVELSILGEDEPRRWDLLRDEGPHPIIDVGRRYECEYRVTFPVPDAIRSWSNRFPPGHERPSVRG
jgi:hypothetical protein